jgi:hypothetical protein
MDPAELDALLRGEIDEEDPDAEGGGATPSA